MRGVAQICCQQTPTPGTYIPGNHDSETCGAIRSRPASREPIPIEVAPLPVDDNIPGEEDIYEAVLRL